LTLSGIGLVGRGANAAGRQLCHAFDHLRAVVTARVFTERGRHQLSHLIERLLDATFGQLAHPLADGGERDLAEHG
jgi:hypothetical protein